MSSYVASEAANCVCHLEAILLQSDSWQDHTEKIGTNGPKTTHMCKIKSALYIKDMCRFPGNIQQSIPYYSGSDMAIKRRL
jgi:hypothetical protein